MGYWWIWVGSHFRVRNIHFNTSRKTQVALEYAYQRREKTGCSVFWVQAGSYTKFVRDYSELAKAVGLTIDPNTRTVLRDVRVWLEKQQNYLLVLDGADDLRLFSPGSQSNDVTQDFNLVQFLPAGDSGTILFTPRMRLLFIMSLALTRW